MKIGFVSVAATVLVFFLAVAASVVGYAALADRLPSPTELQNRQAAFVSSKIYDREGTLLYEVMDPHGGRRTYVPLERISPHLINATIATEDRDFWLHPGFDPIALGRAIYYVLTEREIVSGASTIPQQLARMVLLPEERFEQSAKRKIKEIVLAAEVSRVYSKERILEIYLNELNYGNRAYGIQAAAETYFHTDAADLTLAQASFLAGLPQLPATYDPFGGGLERALARQKDVLRLMVTDGHISAEQAEQAAEEMRSHTFQPPDVDIGTAPHFVVYVRRILEERYGPEALYRGAGLRIYTTLDPDLQAKAEQAVREGIAKLADRNVTNGALVSIEPATGYIRAMVGSVDFNDQSIDGQVNVALRCRQPGSSIKPLTYAASFERNWTPATLLWDVRTEFPDGANPPYVPVNYDRRYHGPVLLRDALANSYNVPAVRALQFVGVEGLLEMASRLGVESLSRPQDVCPEYPYDQPPSYGLALTLGGGEVKLLEMAEAFAAFANQGVHMELSPILRIEDSRGNVVLDNGAPTGRSVLSPEHAYLITDILADDQARCAAFSCPSVLELSRPAAAKTGTTDDYRDAWTVGYTPDLVTGVWVGNSDNAPMMQVPGAAGAGPIWHTFMEVALADQPVLDFERPSRIVEHEICADSGARPTDHCPERESEIFAKGQPPLDESHDWYQTVGIDAFTRLRANEFCPNHVVEELMLDIADERGREWARAHPQQFGNLPLAPLDECTEGLDRPEVSISWPAAGEHVHGVVRITGTVQLPNFDHYEAQYGVGGDPQGWGWISGPHLSPVQDGLLTRWDTTHLDPGLYTLRIRAFDVEKHAVETRVRVEVVPPPATPTPLPTSTPLATPTPFPSATPASTATPSPTATPGPTVTPTPSSTPTATATATPSQTPTMESQ
ncbi:MAG: transglycosylase domain-containing protein [Anaerolineae bacterium]